jgi:hypothetical protein
MVMSSTTLEGNKLKRETRVVFVGPGRYRMIWQGTTLPRLFATRKEAEDGLVVLQVMQRLARRRSPSLGGPAVREAP